MIKNESQPLEAEQMAQNNDHQLTQETITNSIGQKLLNESQCLEGQLQQRSKGAEVAEAKPSKERLMSLDVHRGFTVLGMILVDQMLQIEGACWWLIHPDWDGLTVADLVFPSFLFIMGTAIPLAVNSKKPMKLKNVLRVFLLFAIGLALQIVQGAFDFSQVRIVGILQRLSVCYGIVLFIHWFSEFGSHPIKSKVCAVVMVGFVVLYTALMLSWSNEAEGCPKQRNMEYGCTFAGYVDIAVFGKDHLYQKRAPDPEGIVSTLNAAFTTYIGYIFGLMIQRMKSEPHRLVKYWLIFAFISLLMAYPLSLVMYFNKHLYSISYLFLTLSVCATALSFFMVVADIVPKKYPEMRSKLQTFFTPIIWMGVNPLTIFIIRDLIGSILDGWITYNDGQTPLISFYNSCFSWMGTYVGTLIYSLFYGILFVLLAGVLFKYKLFIKL